MNVDQQLSFDNMNLNAYKEQILLNEKSQMKELIWNPSTTGVQALIGIDNQDVPLQLGGIDPECSTNTAQLYRPHSFARLSGDGADAKTKVSRTKSLTLPVSVLRFFLVTVRSEEANTEQECSASISRSKSAETRTGRARSSEAEDRIALCKEVESYFM